LFDPVLFLFAYIPDLAAVEIFPNRLLDGSGQI
jgi:hypothetical protein